MACDKKWTVFAVLVSVVVVISIVVPVAVFTNAGQSQTINGQASADGGAMSPSEMFLQFAAMIYCTTKANPLDYQGYGCHCGWMNGEAKPVDGTDRCCEKHDFCLKNLETTRVCPKGSFLIPYSVKMKGCGKNRTPKVTCKPSHMYKHIENITAVMKPKCAEALCQCDQRAAMCFSNHRLDERYKAVNMDRAMCRQGTSQSPQPTTPGPQQPTTPAPQQPSNPAPQQPSNPAPQQPSTPAQALGPNPIYQRN